MSQPDIELGIDIIEVPTGFLAKLISVNRRNASYLELWTSPVYDEEGVARNAGLNYARRSHLEVMFRFSDSADGKPVPRGGY